MNLPGFLTDINFVFLTEKFAKNTNIGDICGIVKRNIPKKELAIIIIHYINI